MSLVGIFIQSQPSIGGYIFDAVLSESSELSTEATKYPIDADGIGLIGNDHAVQNPLKIIMRVGVSDNFFRSVIASAGSFSSLASAGISVATGKVLNEAGQLADSIGLGASILNAAAIAGQSSTRSQTMLEAIRELQRSLSIVNVVTTKKEYKGCMITNTRQETNKENEQGLELVIELQQMLITNSRVEKFEIPAPNDTAETQAQEIVNLGQVGVIQ